MSITPAIFSFREPSKGGMEHLMRINRYFLGTSVSPQKVFLVQDLALCLKCLTAEKGKRDTVMPLSSFLLLVTKLAKVGSLGSQ